MNLHDIVMVSDFVKDSLKSEIPTVDLSGYVQKSDIPATMAYYGINSRTQIQEMNTAIDSKMSESAIVKLDSMADFESLTDKTADWYFIKEG